MPTSVQESLQEGCAGLALYFRHREYVLRVKFLDRGKEAAFQIRARILDAPSEGRSTIESINNCCTSVEMVHDDFEAEPVNDFETLPTAIY